MCFRMRWGGKLITRSVGLRSKMYSLCVPECVKEEDREVKRAKGVKRSLLRTQISFENYMHCLLTNEILTKDQISFRTKLHQLFTIKQVNKITLSSLDDKRYLMKCNSNELERENCTCMACKHETLAHGHYRISALNSITSNNTSTAYTPSLPFGEGTSQQNME